MLNQYQLKSLNLPGKYPVASTAGLCAVLAFTASLAIAQSGGPDCQCRAPDGQMRNLGTVECVDIVGNKKLVRCEMSTNTPYWKKIDGVEGCPAA